MEEKNIETVGKTVAQSRVEAFGRLAAAILLCVLVALIAMGVVDADTLTAAVASVLLIASNILIWWKDNNVTLQAIFRHAVEVEFVDDGDDPDDITLTAVEQIATEREGDELRVDLGDRDDR